jgi:hypothetical protein
MTDHARNGDDRTMKSAPATPGVSARPHGGGWALPVALSALIVAWQFGFNAAPPQARARYAMSASMGLCLDAPNFFYFFHHLGQFPVGALEVPHLGPTAADARAFVAGHGDRLKMDFGWPTNTARFGDYGKLFLYYPDVWLRHDPAHPSALPFNELLFIGALLAVFWAFWLERHALLGILVVVLAGSNPFQVLETYGRGNVFSIPISVTLLALAVHLRLLTGRKSVDALAWGTAVASGVALATLREVRPEAALIGLSVAATYLCVRGAPLHRRVLLVAAFLAAGALTGAAWERYWSGRIEAAKAFVARAGGEVFAVPHGTHHAFWHAVCCGLGDYGGDRGFEWDDRAVFRWATTRDAATNPHPIPYHYTTDDYYLDETYDGIHHVAPTDLPEYNRLVRGRVLGTIARHPLWYARVLAQRALAILREATPACVSFGAVTLPLAGVGWLLVPLLAWMLVRRERLHAGIVLFTLPLALLALLVYSGRGMTFYGIAHLVALAAGVDLLVRWRTSRDRGPAATG